jgi:lysophospholipase L1-like esterase
MSSLRILVLGDSLSAGYLGFGSSAPTPAARLQALILEKYAGLEVSITDIAVPGIITSKLLKAFDEVKTDFHKPFDLITVLCGTNDLGYGIFATSTIYENLQAIYASARKHSPEAHIVAATVPSAAHPSPKLIADRQSLNELILGTSQQGISVVDVHDLFPFPQGVPRWNARKPNESLWHEDGLHFSPAGYRRLGEIFFEHLVALEDGARLDAMAEHARTRVEPAEADAAGENGGSACQLGPNCYLKLLGLCHS